MKNRKKDRPKQIIGKIALYAGFVILCTVSALLLLLSRAPAMYRPAIPDHPDQVSPYLTDTLAPDFYNKLQLGRPFTLTIEQTGLNDILARLPLPSDDGISLHAPAAAFTEKAVFLMATVKKNKYSAVAAVSFQPAIDSTGQLRLNFKSVKLGALPATSLAKKILSQNAKSLQSLYCDLVPIEQILAAIIDNRPIDPVFTLDKQTFRLADIKLSKDEIRLTLNPENNVSKP